MPNILVRLPEGVFDANARQSIATALSRTAKRVEQIGDEPRHEFTTWVVFEDIKPGYIFAGGHDPLANVIPAIVFFHHPEGVLEQSGRELAIKLAHEAIADAAPNDGRPVITSVAVTKVEDGAWGVAGNVCWLADFARLAGFKHLQHLVRDVA